LFPSRRQDPGDLLVCALSGRSATSIRGQSTEERLLAVNRGLKKKEEQGEMFALLF
jgi:hypothetical protein